MHKQFMKHVIYFGCVSELTYEESREFKDTVSLALWHAMIDRIFDLFDTVFFVLCKKQNHITFLHVYHHITVVFMLWMYCKYFQGLEFGIVGLCNIFVHMIMYFYYLVAALGPRFKKFLWWKKYLTTLQISQFVVIFFYSLASFWISCGFRKNILYLNIAEAIIHLVLFLNFYRKSYKKEVNEAYTKKMALCGSLQIHERNGLNDNMKEEEKKLI